MTHTLKEHSPAAEQFLQDVKRARWHDETLWFVRAKRDKAAHSLPGWEALREQASRIKAHTLSRLDDYLVEFESKAKENGVRVHWAEDGEEHNRIVHGLLQAVQAESENEFLLGLAEKHPFIKGVVGWVDLQAKDISERLAYYKQFPLVKGFRHVLQGEKDRALMLRPPFQRGMEALGKYGFTYDLLIFPDQLAFATELVMMHPEQQFVLDHLGKPNIKTGEISGWIKDLQVLSSLPNVWCKISGMVTEADWRGWKPDDFRWVLDTAVAAFGTGRLMYGSDWPVCQLAASYAETLGIVQEYFSSFSKSEQDALFGGNATEFYNL